MNSPDFLTLLRLEEQLLQARLDVVRASISHAGEKGRGLEHEAMSLVRAILPPEYGLATGFIVGDHQDGEVKLSPQLDIIIYDALRGAPLISVGPSQVFPIECVYGYIEVKAQLRGAWRQIYEANAFIRGFEKRHYLVHPHRAAPNDHFDPLVVSKAMSLPAVRIRSFVIGFEYTGDCGDVAGKMQEAFLPRSHFHSVFVPNTFLATNVAVRSDEEAQGKANVVPAPKEGSLLALFKAHMLSSLGSYPRPPEGYAYDLRPYFKNAFPWDTL